MQWPAPAAAAFELSGIRKSGFFQQQKKPGGLPGFFAFELSSAA
jgi:hypothetical protein